ERKPHGANATGYQTNDLRNGIFFFSSRRRHTRFKCDWSSDVCSSDLEKANYATVAGKALGLFNADYERYGVTGASYALELDSYFNGPIGITIIAPSKSKQFIAFKAEALKLYPARRYVRYLDPARDVDQIDRLGFDAGKAPVAYVCAGKTCGPPISDPANIDPSLSSLLAN